MSLTLEQVLTKSAKKISGLDPVVQAAATALIERAFACGVPIVITQGLRTYEEQNELYSQGRTKPGSIVTQARGGYSNHNFGLAIDFALLQPNGSAVSWNMSQDGDGDHLKDWGEVVEIAKALGFTWGGDWTSFKDYPHFEMTFDLSTAKLRAGQRPTKAQVAAVMAKINAKEDEGMTPADRKVLDDLTDKVKRLEAQLTELQTLDTVPSWAAGSVNRALAKKAITDQPGTNDFYRLVVILDRLGLFN
jgi:peptidoglycan L-alanyl-D-glutamate endopeptidase CwlK